MTEETEAALMSAGHQIAALQAQRDALRIEVDQLRTYAGALNQRCIRDAAELGRLTAEHAKLASDVEQLLQAASYESDLSTRMMQERDDAKERAEFYLGMCREAQDIALRHSERIGELTAERDALLLQARCWSHEAKAQQSTVYECYRACTGGTGEPGDWHGAEPVRQLVAERDALRADAERYRWLKGRQGLTLRSEKQPNLWKRIDGTAFSATHSLAEGGTQHAPADSLDALIDAAMLAARIRDARGHEIVDAAIDAARRTPHV